MIPIKVSSKNDDFNDLTGYLLFVDCEYWNFNRPLY